jgi:type I restriction enzyme, S subunit
MGLKDLPIGWIMTDLQSIVINPMQDIVDGPFGSNLKSSEYKDSGFPLIRIQNIDRNNFKNDNIKFVSQRKFEQIKRHSFKSGDIVITKLGQPLGKACIIPYSLVEGIIVADLVRLRINNEYINSKFLTYQINSEKIIKQFQLHTKGTTRLRVNLAHVKNINIVLPPLLEQQRIVEKLDILLNKLDASLVDLKYAQRQIGYFRQSVLKDAFEGKLLENEVNTEEWEWVQLGNVSDNVGKSKDYNLVDEFVYIDINAIDNSSLKIVEPKKYKWRDAPSRAQQIIKTNDILFSTVRTYLKNIAYVSKDYDNQVASTGFCVIRSKINSKYVFYLVQSNSFLEPLNKIQRGTSYPAVRNSDVFERVIPVPPNDIQQKIVEKIETLFSQADVLELENKKHLKQAEILRGALLKAAFEGKLVAQDPKDEPADTLLQQIKEAKKQNEAARLLQKQIDRKLPKEKNITKNMDNTKDILQILQEHTDSNMLTAKEVWQTSKWHEDIESFYAELKELIDYKQVVEDIKQGKESYLRLKALEKA